jgi:anti-sigma-K factor RskA
MSGETDLPEDDMEMLAAEYVLGLLTVAQLPHVAAWREGSARFDQAVQQWELRLLPLAEALEPVRPGPRVWPAIAGAVGPGPQRGGVWRSLNFWRGFSLVASAVCAVLVAFMLRQQPPAPSAIALLATKGDGIFIATAQAGASGVQLLVRPSQVSLPAGKSAELWLIAPGGKPAALGLLPAAGPVAFTLSSVSKAEIVQVKLAVSLEPPGGSVSGQPTGPVIAIAGLSPL